MDVALNQQGSHQERYPPSQHERDGIDLHGFLRLLWRRKALILVTIASCTGLAGGFAFLVTPKYQAKTQLLFEDEGNFVVDRNTAQDRQRQDEQGVLSQVQVLQSRGLAQKVVEELHLQGVKEFDPGAANASIFALLTGLLPSSHRDEAGQADPEDAAQSQQGQQGSAPPAPDEDVSRRTQLTNGFLSRLKVNPVGRSSVVEITFSAEDPALAATAANALAETYMSTGFTHRLQQAQQASEWLATHAQKIKADVEKTERTLEDYRKANDLLQGDRMMLLTQEVTDLNKGLTDASTALALADAELAQAKLAAKTGDVAALSQVLESGLIQKLREEEVGLERVEAEMGERYGPLYPQMMEFRAAKQEFQEKTKNEVNKVLRSLEGRVEVARLRKDEMSRALNALKEQVGEANSASVRLRTLEKDAEASRLLLEKFMTSFMEMNAQQDVQAQVPQASIISRAAVPSTPSFPNKPLMLLMGLIGGTILSVPLAFAADGMNSGYRSAREVEFDTGLPVLAHVPDVSRSVKSPDLVLYVSKKPDSVFTEAIRLLCTRLLLSSWCRPHQTFVIVSSQAAEGKTTITLCLARVLANSGRRVLVIDADFRCGKVATALGLDREPGLAELIAGAASLEDVIQHHGQPAVDVITSGAYASDSADDLAREGLAEVLQELRSRYDMVLIDAPPFLALASPSVLASQADVAVVVAAWSATPREALKYTVEQIRNLSPCIAGVVLNKINLKKNGEYDYGDATIFGTKSNKYYVS